MGSAGGGRLLSRGSQMSESAGESSEPEMGELDGKVTQVFIFIFDKLSERGWVRR